MLEWKLIDGKRAVKARLVVRGFKDRQGDDVQTAASTASRMGQRLVCQLVAQQCWRLFSFDVSDAFLQGETFEEQAGSSDAGSTSKALERAVQLEIPKGPLRAH